MTWGNITNDVRLRQAHPAHGNQRSGAGGLSAWCERRYDWTFEREQMQTSLGVIPALFGLVEYLTSPGEKVLALTPSYGYFKHATVQSDRVFDTSRLLKQDNGRYEIDFDDFERKVKDPAVKLFLLCHPHNPTGRVWTET